MDWQKRRARRIEEVKARVDTIPTKACRQCSARKEGSGFRKIQKGPWKVIWAGICLECEDKNGKQHVGINNLETFKERVEARGKAPKFKKGFDSPMGLKLEALLHKTQQMYFMKGYGSALRCAKMGVPGIHEATCWATVTSYKNEIEFLKEEILQKARWEDE